MKPIILALLLVFCALSLAAQTSPTQYSQGNITATGATCGTTNACITLVLQNNAIAESVALSGTFTATITFEASYNNGTTWVSEGTSTSAGTTTFSLGSATQLRARCSAFTSGTVVVYINSTLAMGGGGSGSGGAGGSTSDVQFNTAGTLTGNPAFTFDTSTDPIFLGLGLNDPLGAVDVDVPPTIQTHFVAAYGGAPIDTGFGISAVTAIANMTGATDCDGSNCSAAIFVDSEGDTASTGSDPEMDGIAGNVIANWATGSTSLAGSSFGIGITPGVNSPTIPHVYGYAANVFFATGTPTVTDIYSFEAAAPFKGTATPTISDMAGVHIEGLDAANSFNATRTAAVEIEDQGSGKYGIYEAGVNSLNQLAKTQVFTLSTATNCIANGSAANPSVAACGSASAGMFSCATAATTGTCQVNTTAVTANSEILITQDAADGGASQLNVTCNTALVTAAAKPILLSKNAGTSFTINLGTVSVNPGCFEYHIVN